PDDVALDAEHQFIPGADEFRLQPAPVLFEQLFRQLREELQRLEERTLLLDDAVDRDVADFELGARTMGLRVNFRYIRAVAR
ncbi:MAG: hypothetical protein ACHQDD_11770, partial [Steroidobacterales bacterium]